MAYSLESEARILLLSVSRLSVSIIEFSGEKKRTDKNGLTVYWLREFAATKTETKIKTKHEFLFNGDLIVSLFSFEGSP